MLYNFGAKEVINQNLYKEKRVDSRSLAWNLKILLMELKKISFVIKEVKPADVIHFK
jgi:hypothetical protein